jgi:hypothetical protein
MARMEHSSATKGIFGVEGQKSTEEDGSEGLTPAFIVINPDTMTSGATRLTSGYVAGFIPGQAYAPSRRFGCGQGDRPRRLHRGHQ